MPDSERPLLGELRDELSGAAGELSRLVSLRWRLAEIELRESARTAKRFGIFALASLVLLLTSFPVFGVALALWLDRVAPLAWLSWLWIVGLVSAGSGIAIFWFSRRQFRREFRGLEQSLEEIREDLVWLQEWTGRSPNSEETSTDEPNCDDRGAGDQ